MSAVTVRMYNVGFGDAFLVSIPDGGREYTVLVDCGSIAKADKAIKDIADEIKAAVTKGGEAKIDVVIATHRHKDHVAGFESDTWKDVSVGEVWLPWTEDPRDPEATRIRNRQLKLAEVLTRALAARGSDDPLYSAVLNAAGNEKAMTTLHTGFAGKPERKFLPRPGERRVSSQVLPATVKVHLLGPSRDEAVIRDIDPPKAESYLRYSGTAGISGAKDAPLFGPQWRLETNQFVSQWSHLALDPQTVLALNDLDELTSPELAATLDKAINGTSLVLVFEIGAACLVFPGDAQWGTWSAILQDSEWRELLQRSTFLKIGHHGSHNASPISFVEELLPKDLWAMVSTRPIKQWPNIPRKPLIQAILKKTAKLARTDDQTGVPTPAFSIEGDCIRAEIPMG